VKLRITLEGASYDVDVEVLHEKPEPTTAVEPDTTQDFTAPPPPPDIRPEDRICRSPIAGAVVSVVVSVGDRLRKDDTVAIIEAMKMEICIGAPLDGTVAEVSITAGEAVMPGQVLCTLTE
jgi:methylmalonyl-CoA carboxyltransferase small subunit